MVTLDTLDPVCPKNQVFKNTVPWHEAYNKLSF